MTEQKFILGDNVDVLKTYPDNYFDSVVTDAPYGLGKEPEAMLVLKDWIEKGHHEIKSKGGFMGKGWDSFVPQPIFWKEVFRVLKPGGHVLCFFGTRTYDWGVMAMRLAGFEIRDCIQWLYGSGFPKSLNISKSIDKAAGVERKVVGVSTNGAGASQQKLQNHFSGDTGIGILDGSGKVFDITEPATEEAKQWDGWGTALKPANEPIVMARKPLIGTVVENTLAHGVGGINIDACRVATDEIMSISTTPNFRDVGKKSKESIGIDKLSFGQGGDYDRIEYIPSNKGQFPANIIFDEEAAEILDAQTGILKSGAMKKHYEYTNNGTSLGKPTGSTKQLHESNEGGASRFFYTAKVGQKERHLGCGERGNKHPTVKPISLMRYLVKLVTPKDGICLDPFNGSGSTGIASKLEGLSYIGIDFEEDNINTSEARILAWGSEDEEEGNSSQLKLGLV